MTLALFRTVVSLLLLISACRLVWTGYTNGFGGQRPLRFYGSAILGTITVVLAIAINLVLRVDPTAIRLVTVMTVIGLAMVLIDAAASFIWWRYLGLGGYRDRRDQRLR